MERLNDIIMMENTERVYIVIYDERNISCWHIKSKMCVCVVEFEFYANSILFKDDASFFAVYTFIIRNGVLSRAFCIILLRQCGKVVIGVKIV